MSDNRIWALTTLANLMLAVLLLWEGRWKRARLLALNHTISLAIAAVMAFAYFSPAVPDSIYAPLKHVTDGLGIPLSLLLLFEASIPFLARLVMFTIFTAHLWWKSNDLLDLQYHVHFYADYHYERKLWNIAVILACCIAVYCMEDAPASRRLKCKN